MAKIEFKLKINYNPTIALLAQLVEQLPLKEMVGGSNPSQGTKNQLTDFCALWVTELLQSHRDSKTAGLIFSAEKIAEVWSRDFMSDGE